MPAVWVIAGVAVLLGLFLLSRALGTNEESPANDKSPPNPPPDDKESKRISRASLHPKSESEEPEGSKVASVRPPAAEVVKTKVVEPEVPLDIVDDTDDPTGPHAMILVNAVGRTDAGRRRKHNEDAYLVMEGESLFVIADGMGGYAAGEVASQLAVDVIAEAYRTKTFSGDVDPNNSRRADEFVRAVAMANMAILTQSRANEAQAGMGTTLVGCRFSPNRQRVYIAHVGDSRCYRLRDGVLKQITQDHTLGAVGITGPAAAKLSRAVGIQETVEVEINVDAPKPGDHYVLCSDGLSKMVPDDMIRDLLIASKSDINRSVETLVETANERGGRDNVTVILIRVEEASFKQ